MQRGSPASRCMKMLAATCTIQRIRPQDWEDAPSILGTLVRSIAGQLGQHSHPSPPLSLNLPPKPSFLAHDVCSARPSGVKTWLSHGYSIALCARPWQAAASLNTSYKDHDVLPRHSWHWQAPGGAFRRPGLYVSSPFARNRHCWVPNRELGL